MTFDELKEQFTGNGFKIEGDSFILEKTEYSTININGHIHQQPHTTRFEMTYIGECPELDDSDNPVGDPLYGFNIMHEGEIAYTICVDSFESFTKLAQ